MAATDDPPSGDKRISTHKLRAIDLEPGVRSAPEPRRRTPASGSGRVMAFADEDHTDVIGLATPPLARRAAELERQYIVSVLHGPQTGLTRALDQDSIVIGRAGGCDFVLDDTALSRRHCRIYRNTEGLVVEDLGSSNGTFLDGKMVSTPQRIDDGARIHLGRQTVLSLSRQDPLEQNAARQLYESAMRDALTGVYNRRSLDQRMREEFAYALRHKSSLSFLLLDLDHFKRINDTFGHPAGDAVLRHVGELVPRYLRREDVAARYGGEEFAIVARSIGVEGARTLGERIRKRIAEAPVTFGHQSIPITGSIGIATLDERKRYASADALLAAADQALYRAKEGGRNRCEDDRRD
jgi:two-component system cell cycle response regulator